MRTLLAGIALVAILAPLAAQAGPPRLVPHRAVFDLSLRDGASDGGIERLDGRLVFELQSDCQGYVLNQRIFTRATDGSGQAVANDYNVSTWESDDGTLYRFSVRNEVNGQVIEVVDGQASLDGPGGAGSVTFVEPAEAVAKLPAGTVFPSEHTAMVVAAAEDGRRVLSVPVFDGSGEDGLSNTFAVIGPARPGPDAADWPLMVGKRSWSVNLAYFPVRVDGERSAAEVPEMEIKATLFENGVTKDLVLDYGDLVLDGKMIELKALPVPNC
ncbi:MAG: DUF1849 family protein [Alphaproteobacteria bacterium]